MNTLILKAAELGQSLSLYGTINTVVGIISLLFSIWHAKKLGISLWKALIIIFVIYEAIGLIQSLISPILSTIKDTHFLGIETKVNSIVRVFIFLPLLAIPLARIFRLKWSLVCDAIALHPLLTSALAQIACIFPGCCQGYEVNWGIYSVKTGQYHFPVQILETILTLAVFSYLIYQLYRRKYTSNGMLYPEMMTLYGIARFICEGLRDNEKIFLGCSAVALHAFVLFAVGFGILLHKQHKEKTSTPTEETLPEDVAPPIEAEIEPAL